MTPAELDRLCALAMARIVSSINRSAGQHLRALRKEAAERAARLATPGSAT